MPTRKRPELEAGDPPKRNFGVSSHKERSIMLGVERKSRKSLHKVWAKGESVGSSPVIVHMRDGVGKDFSGKVSIVTAGVLG